MEEYAREQGYGPDFSQGRFHHEIYLSDVRRCQSGKLKTVIRQPIKRTEVPNSFAEWMNAAGYDFVITHPEGYELAPQFVGNARVEYDHRKALEGADFVYAKNWAACLRLWTKWPSITG